MSDADDKRETAQMDVDCERYATELRERVYRDLDRLGIPHMRTTMKLALEPLIEEIAELRTALHKALQQ